MNLLELINQNEKVQTWQRGFTTGKKQLITGLSGGIKALVMATSLNHWNKKVVIVTSSLYAATQLADDLRSLFGDEKVQMLPFDEVIAAEFAFQSPEARSERIAALDFLVDSKKTGFLVVPIVALRKSYPTIETWKNAHLTFQNGEVFPFGTLRKKLISMGYVEEAMVMKPGEFSVRGSIVDIYPLTFAYPVRVEFFDDEVDSIRQFDTDTQRTIENKTQTIIPPAREFVFSEEDFEHGVKTLQEKLAAYEKRATSEQDAQIQRAYFEKIMESLANGVAFEDVALYLDLLYKEPTSLLDYLPQESLLFVDDFSRCQEVNTKAELEEGEYLTIKLAEKKAFDSQILGKDAYLQLRDTKVPQTYFSLFHKGFGNLKFQTVHTFTNHSMQQFFGQMPLLKTEMARFRKGGNTVVVLVDEKERMAKVEELFREWDILAVQSKWDKLVLDKIQIVAGSLSSGFEFVDEKLVVINENEIFYKAKKKRARRQNITNAERIKSYNELSIGDYVVHQSHGVGKYIGMETIELDGVHQDYMTIVYQNDDKLFIPVTQLSMIHKYTSSAGSAPKINKLSDNKWSKTKTKAIKQVEDIADDLMELYAKRKAQKGFAFSKDDAYQDEFEHSFTYTETEDQLRSTQEIKQDMEKEQPMDRLLVGDVGFGKTEVALRASFKAIQNNKQVAILVPTTILAQQHYQTIIQRFENFPVNIGLLSRFRTKKEQDETIRQLKKGQLDIIVGTHRLLSKDIEFFDIGLIIVDEEQRFGVKHKERLKQLKTQVDVLTLTATPIPRTLHMSMMGVRDLSVIETPPANRYPVQTYVMEKNKEAIREAILREISRGGQAFYLYNRVETIEQCAAELQELVPEAVIGFAHGQMTSTQMENVLYDFIDGQYDVLVSTTIIETGVDIPNANTLFVENADFMGLSTLYQLRGRVGRSNRVAYAYFMYQSEKVLTEVSEKRLEAIKDFTELGSGFKIAMRDLSIRGAGNLLGSEQSGFIDSIGFELYSQMLEEAVKKRRGQEETSQQAVEIDLGIDAYVPKAYIIDERQKIEIYKRVRSIENTDVLEELKEDLVDRFGEYPKEVNNLLDIGLIKMLAERVGLETIRRKKEKNISVITLVMSEEATEKYQGPHYFEALSEVEMQANLNLEKEKMNIVLKTRAHTKDKVWVKELITFLTQLKQLKNKATVELG